MRRPSRPARIVTVCVRGHKAKKLISNTARIDLLHHVIELICRRDWHPIDAVLFPGGYFRLADFIGRLPYAQRCRSIGTQPFAQEVFRATHRLRTFSSGAIIVAGCDSSSPYAKDIGDHTCVAFGAKGVLGIARKIFPADLDTRECTRAVIPAVGDFDTPHRFIQLPNGTRALLAACYDLFGLTEDHRAPGRRSRFIRALWTGDRYEADRQGFRELRRACLARWHDRLAREAPSVALCAIHGFKRPGLDGYWQRHGIAAASSALAGGLAIGAAHFRDGLPQRPDLSALAATRVPRTYLRLWARRPARSLDPLESFTARTARFEALVRLFQA